MFHIGEEPAAENAPIGPSPGPKFMTTRSGTVPIRDNRQMIQHNLYTLCLDVIKHFELDGPY